MSSMVTSELSDNLICLMEQFTPHTKTGLNLSPTEVSNVVFMLAALHRLSVSVETELNCHRIGEANRFAGDMVENLATETLGSLLIETDGNIIRPRFGKEPKTP